MAPFQALTRLVARRDVDLNFWFGIRQPFCEIARLRRRLTRTSVQAARDWPSTVSVRSPAIWRTPLSPAEIDQQFVHVDVESLDDGIDLQAEITGDQGPALTSHPSSASRIERMVSKKAP